MNLGSYFNLLLFLALLSITGSGRASEVLAIDDKFQQVALGNYIRYIEASGEQVSLDALLMSAPTWLVPAKNPPNFGFSYSGYWFKVQIANTTSKAQSLMLSIEYPLLDYVDVFLLIDGQVAHRYTVGDKFPFAARPLPNRHFVMPLEFAAQKEAQLYVYLKTSGSAQLPAILWNKDAFYQRDAKQSLELGLYYGFLTIMVFYNLFLYFTVKERAYLAYVLYVTTFCLTQASLSGHSYQYLWPTQTHWNDVSFPVMVYLANVGAAIFSLYFLSLKQHSRRLYHVVLVMASVAAVFACATLFVLGRFNFFRYFSALLTVVTTLIMLGIGFYLWRNGMKHARFYLMGWTAFLAGAALLSLAIIGVLPLNIITEHGAKAGSVVEVVLLSFALADRINVERQEKQEAQKRMQELRFELFQESFKQKELLVANEAAMRAKDEFLSTMSHEIRTPMNGVIGVLQLLEDTPMDVQQKELVRIINGSAQSLLSIINDILDFSKIQAGKMQIENVTFDLHLLLQDLAGLYGMTTKLNDELEFSLCIATSVPRYVKGDPLRVKQILTNYLNNAVKFTAKGNIQLSAECLPNSLIKLSVRDSGIGIDEIAQKKLFQSFSQTSQDTARIYGGTGLGLAICKKLAELMGGSVGVESAIGHGSTFWCTLALTPADSPECSETADNKALIAGIPNAKILVAEDNAVNQFVVKNMLRKLGINDVTMAENGEEALKLLAENTFDLVLMDCNMPVMDGFEATHRIREHEACTGSRRLPIAALTANATKEEQDLTQAAGMDAHITKPLVLADLAVALQYLLKKKD